MHQARIEFPAGAPPRPLPQAASRRAIAIRQAVAARPRRDFQCLECAEPFQSVEAHAEFCCASHRKAWNNRRAVRGAEVYDFIMAMRFERGLAARLMIGWALVCRLASAYRDADLSLRDGRRSWRKPKTALASLPMAYGRDGDGR